MLSELTGYQILKAVTQLSFFGHTGNVSFVDGFRKDPVIQYYQLNDDGSFNLIGNFTNDSIFIDDSALNFGDGVPISGRVSTM